MSKCGRVTNSFLRKQSNRAEVDAHVREIIDVIDANILRAHKTGFNTVTYEMPTNLIINNMDKSDAEALVFSSVIETYKGAEEDGGRGFDTTYLTRSGEKVFIHIKWVNGMDPAEREARKQTIKDAFVAPRSKTSY